MTLDHEGDDLARVCSLDDATRRRLYDHVVEAATALDLDRSLVAYHLDKLVDAGLLTATFARPAGRGGPGAGRPAKHYQRVGEEIAVSLPPRDYRLAAELLARAATDDRGHEVREALAGAATDLGTELAAAAGATGSADLVTVLARQGFEPYEDGDVVRLRNCPFHRLARQHTELICGMNLALLGALAAAVDGSVTARLDPAPDRCCVAFDR